MAAPTLSLRALNRATLGRQLLLTREPVGVVPAVQHLVGLQAQLARPPYLALWSRLAEFSRECLHGAFLRRELVRATSLRCTLHVMTATDYVALRATLQPVLDLAMHAALRERAKTLDVASLVAAARPFFAAQPRTFEALRDHLLARDPTGDERAMGYAVRTHLPLVQIPTDAPWGFPGSSDFTDAETWLATPLAADPRPGDLVLRYLAAFGPATVADAQNWSGLRGLRETFASLRPSLRVYHDDRGKDLFDLPEAPLPSEKSPAPVRFLPEWDALVMGHDDRRRVIADEHRPRVYRPGLRVLPTFLIDGFVSGTWKSVRTKSTATLVIEPFTQLARHLRETLADEADRLVRFIDPEAHTHAVDFVAA